MSRTPPQVVDLPWQGKRKASSGMEKLARAMLFQAFYDAAMPPRRNLLYWQQDAREWFSETEDGPGSLDWVCQVLKADPKPMRAAASTFSGKDKAEIKLIARRFLRITS